MRPARLHALRSRVALAVFVVTAAGACGSVPDDPGARIFPPGGVIRGTVVYAGPRPCSRAGHIVGNAIILVFDRRNPPPPEGLATTAANFADVMGDVLFGNEPRYTGPNVYCPQQAGFTETISASAPFEVAPLAGGSYEIHAFFDYTGNFLPEFATRNLPEQGDVGGGAIDTADAIKPVNAGNPNYLPRFLPVDVGLPQVSSASATGDYVIPDRGFVADNVAVTIGSPLRIPRPYFFAQGEQVAFDFAKMALTSSMAQSSGQRATDMNGIDGAAEKDPNSMPILTIPQDIEVFAPPTNVSASSTYFFESAFPHLRLVWGVPADELATAAAPPFGMQVASVGQGPRGAGFSVWQNAVLDATTQKYEPQQIPEGNVPQLWPQVVLTRLGTNGGASAPGPIIVLEAITLRASDAADHPDSLYGTAAAGLGGLLFDATSGRARIFQQDHLTAVLRPSVICFPSASEPGTLVTPHPMATTADLDCSTSPCVPSGTPGQLIAPSDLLDKLGPRVNAVATACLPTGRYGISVVYPDGQAWSVPNEAGACSGGEGSTDYVNLTCTLKPRPVLYSQGNRAVVEVVAAKDSTHCQAQLPDACLGSQ
jgi:hypothetical protein